MDGKVIAITGGASGIGLSLAKLLLSRGASVSIADISQASLDEASKDLRNAGAEPEKLLACQCDVRKLETVQDWLKQTVDKFGKLDGAANLAGVISKSQGQAGIDKQSEEEWDFVIGVNLTGVMHSMKSEFQHMNPHTNCSIVNAASVAGLVGLPNSAAYCASKHGVIGLTRVGAKEGAALGIRVNCIAPGVVDTPMLMQAEAASANGGASIDNVVKRMPIPRKAEAAEVAKVVAFLLSEESSFVTGAVYGVDGGWNC